MDRPQEGLGREEGICLGSSEDGRRGGHDHRHDHGNDEPRGPVEVDGPEGDQGQLAHVDDGPREVEGGYEEETPPAPRHVPGSVRTNSDFLNECVN